MKIRIRSIRLIEIKREIMNMYLMLLHALLMLVVGFRVNAAGRGKEHTIDSFKYFLNIKGCGQNESSR